MTDTELITGQDVTVTFDGIDHAGHIERIQHGWIHCRIAIQPAADYGMITARLAPHSTVCVRADQVKPNESENR